MTHKIEITVSGFAGSGKTTVAELLFDLLSKEGFAETIHVPMEQLSAEFYTRKKERQEAVKPRTTIVIREKQAPRSNYHELESEIEKCRI